MKLFSTYLDEEKAKLVLTDLPYKRDALAPVMSKNTIDYHYGHLAKGYVKKYNKGEGDPDFNYGGAVLHNIFFANLTPPRAANKPEGISKTIIDDVYGSFEKFKAAFEKEFMAAQGSNWIYMDYNGDVKTIHNHQYRKGMKIALLIDAWEHAWALDYQSDKKKYLENIWRIINWEVINSRVD